MSMIPAALPVSRPGGKTFRDDRLFYIGCDDRYAPDQYFGFFKLSRIKLCVIPACDDKSHAMHVLQKLLSVDAEEDDERWMILDTDHCLKRNHFQSYEQATVSGGDKPVANTTRVYKLWHNIIAKASVSQLPKCLQALSQRIKLQGE